MPLYEYICETCGRRFERLQRFDDPPPNSCPAGHVDVRRLLGHPAIHFKGSGFYITDHKNSTSSNHR